MSNTSLDISRNAGDKNPLVLSYLGLRKVVGFIGFLLPFVLISGKLLASSHKFGDPWVQGSISDYYYTNMGDVFVGSLCAIGIFLASCRGYDRRDAIAGHLACFFAVGVALCPTTPNGEKTTLIGGLHLTCATLLFLTLSYFCLKLFTETSPTRTPTRKKRQRNAVYITCGVIMLISIFLISVSKATGILSSLNPTLWLESVAIVTFGVAWLTKGEAILKDENEPQESLDRDREQASAASA